MPASQRTIVVFEPTCQSGEHAPFNAGLLESVLTIVDSAVFFADATHLDAVLEILEPSLRERIEWRPMVIPPRRVNSASRRLPREWAIVSRAWDASNARRADALISTSVTTAGLLAMKLQALLHPRTRPIGIVFHSVLDRVMTEAPLRQLARWLNSSNLRFLVLGESLRREVQAQIPGLRGVLHPVTHPYPFDTAPSHASQLAASEVRFGFLGLANPYKGFPEFVALAQEFGRHNVKFELVGRVGAECESLIEELSATGPLALDIPDVGERVPLSVYRERLQALSYAVFPYHAIDYRFVRSGAALDAVWAGKPLIALRIPALQELFDRMGDIGYLCDDLTEIRQTIAHIVANPPTDRYTRQSENLIRGRALFSGPAIGQELARALGLSPNGASAATSMPVR